MEHLRPRRAMSMTVGSVSVLAVCDVVLGLELLGFLSYALHQPWACAVLLAGAASLRALGWGGARNRRDGRAQADRQRAAALTRVYGQAARQRRPLEARIPQQRTAGW